MLMKFLALSFIYISKNSVIYYTDFLTGHRMLFIFTIGYCRTLLISLSFKSMKTIVKGHQVVTFKKSTICSRYYNIKVNLFQWAISFLVKLANYGI